MVVAAAVDREDEEEVEIGEEEAVEEEIVGKDTGEGGAVAKEEFTKGAEMTTRGGRREEARGSGPRDPGEARRERF